MGRHLRDVRHVVGSREQMGAGKTRDADYKHPVEIPLIVLQDSVQVPHFRHGRRQIHGFADVFHNGSIVLVHQHHGERTIGPSQGLNQVAQQVRRRVVRL